mgnify:CR=1 FL=1
MLQFFYHSSIKIVKNSKSLKCPISFGIKVNVKKYPNLLRDASGEGVSEQH